ncbi:MAG TPA: PAS domain-containing protein [Thermodesulfovibrionales bacterium]|nr:PAS domain-containing protein [Thermodesulfovibrionales bacterium]
MKDTKNDRKTSPWVFANPSHLLVLIVVSIFLAEALVSLVLIIVPPSSKGMLIFLDAGLLTVILFPVVYYLVYKPVSLQIEQLRRSDEALLSSEERYRSIVESTDDSIYLVDKQYRYLYMNRKHMRRMGFSEGEYVGRCFSEFHSDGETRDFIEKVDMVFEKNMPEQHGHHSERDDRYFLRTFSPLHGPDGEVVAVSVVSKKITRI